jgi:hypothetical protein
VTGGAPGSARQADGPELSVILATDGVPPARRVISHLQAQTARDRLELVLVTPSANLPGEVPELPGFQSVKFVEADTTSSTPAARAAGVRAATAPVVVMAETHCFPEVGWAEALIAAHRGPWAAVGPEIENENPNRPTSWGNMLVDYSPWVAPAGRGPVEDLPGHNTSYKRSLLLVYGPELDRLLESETVMHWDLRSRGHRLFLEPAAKVRHRNVTRLAASVVEHFHNGRVFGALRARDWSPARRAAYAAGCPLMPLLRLSRILRHARRAGWARVLARALPVMLAALCAHAAGELVGYAAGSGNAVRRMAPYELHRDRYLEEVGGDDAIPGRPRQGAR